MRAKILYVLLGLVFLIACNSPKTTDPLFRLLSSEATGVNFANTLQESDSLNIMNFIYLYNGAGVAAGDVNGDGLPDLFFSGNQISSKLYLNHGEFDFQDISLQAGIQDSSWSTGVSLIDINCDGLLDIYVSTAHPNIAESSPNLLYINLGLSDDGLPHFSEQASAFGLADLGYDTHAAFFDYDIDGDLDVYILTNGLGEVNSRSRPRMTGPIEDGSAQSNDRLYRNEGPDENGQIKFVDVSKETGILIEGWGLGIGINDFNNDGWPDIYIANDFLTSDLLYINKGKEKKEGDPYFVNEIGKYLKHQSHNGMGVDIADFNNDALPDIIELDMMPDDNARKKSMFGSINNDLWHLKTALGYQPQYVRNTLQLNNGNGTFSEIGQMAGVFETDWSWAPLLLDVDNDGFKDLLITNGYHRDVTDLDYINYRSQATNFGTEEEKDKKVLSALNKLIGVKKSNYIFRNNGDLTFENKSAEWGFDQPSYSNGATYADFDLDGDLDIVTNNINAPAFIYRNLAQEQKGEIPSSYLRIKLEGPMHNPIGIGAKVQIKYKNEMGHSTKQMHYQNLYRGYKSTVEEVIHFGLGAVSMIDEVLITWPDGQHQLLTEIKANQVLDLSHQNASQSHSVLAPEILPIFVDATITSRPLLHKENNYNDFNISVLKTHKHSQNGPGMSVGDVDGNGLEDVFIGGAKDFAGIWLLQISEGHFSIDSMKMDRQHEDMGSLIFDADSDGDLDLYVVSGGNEELEANTYYQDRLYLNNGYGKFERDSTALPTISSSGSCVIGFDYDRDGDIDLFVGGRVVPGKYPLAPKSILLKNEQGKFLDVTTIDAQDLQEIGMVTSALWTDIDQDGWQDLMLVGEWMPITYFKNEQGILKLYSDSNLASTSGWWNSLAAGDFDQDGDMDYIAGNVGQNTMLHASEEEPICIYAKDFDNNGSLDPVLCYYVQGKNYPYHPRDVLIKQIVAMRRRFPDYNTYGKATLDGVLTKEELAGAIVVKSSTFSSSYIENLGPDGFAIKALPNLAQIAPVYGIEVSDWSGDGILDLILVGNSYAMDAHLGNFDAMGGLFLRGKGDGSFDPISALESGIWINGDAKSVIKVASGRQQLTLVANNQGPLMSFQTTSNLDLISIPLLENEYKLEIEDNSGNRWVDEQYYGSGYLSQDSRNYIITKSAIKVTAVSSQGKRRLIYDTSNQL